MATYASPKIIKHCLLLINSLCFCLGCYLLIYSTILIIGIENNPTFESHHTYHFGGHRSQTGLNSTSNSTGDEENEDVLFEDRFPSVGSNAVLCIFGFLTLVVSILGITGANMENSRLLQTYCYLSFIAFFIRCLFLIATLRMHTGTKHFHLTPLAMVSVSIGFSEVMLGMCACHFAKIIKRGDVVEHQIPKYEKS